MQPASTPPAATSQPAAHFVYNSLNLLQAYIQEGDKSGALAYLSRFSSLLRQWLNHASMAAAPLGAEILLLEKYLALERERFAARFDFVVTQYIVHADRFLVKPLAWQSAVERALQHALKAGSGLLRITFTLEDGGPACVVCAGIMQPDHSSGSFTFEQTVSLHP